jgi:hypothetical protein
MSSLHRTAGWVIVRKSTEEAVFETFNKKTAGAINQEKYRAVPILEHLGNINKRIRGADGVQPT